MGFIGVQPATIPLTASDITNDIINADKIADSSISEEHLDPTVITGLSALAEEPADTDEFIISDAGTLKRIDAQYVGGGSLVKLMSSSEADGNATQVYATNIFSSTYDNYLVTGFIAPQNNSEIRFRWTTGGGTTQYSTGDYNWIATTKNVDSSHNLADQDSGYHAESYIPICFADLLADGDSAAGSFTFTISDPNTNILDRPYVNGTSVYRNGGSSKFYTERFGGTNEADPNATGFILYMSSGNIRDHMYKFENGKKIDLTESEIADYNALQKETADLKPQRQLKKIKQERLQRLIETDYMANSDYVMEEKYKTYRKAMRDIPQNYSADKYDELLATDDDGNLTHSVWSKP